MFEFLNFLRTDDLDWLSVTVRLVLAVFLGGFIGIERERKGRAAGFRTHILICLGAAMTTLTSQYIVFELGYYADLSRIGAQVIAGVGFIGAGTVMVIKRRQIKGITTAAGIWTAAIVGLCCGAGFYEGAVLATVLVLLVEILFSRLENVIASRQTVMNIYVEYSESGQLVYIVDAIKKYGSSIIGLEVRNGAKEQDRPCAIFSLRLSKKYSYERLANSIKKVNGVLNVEKI
ncbi:MAG: MgtC/SapB family protein [Ruminococcaceae bacterium]|nr:MgtC/SapB family protein [Oscillospiraceae bacterium]